MFSDWIATNQHNMSSRCDKDLKRYLIISYNIITDSIETCRDDLLVELKVVLNAIHHAIYRKANLTCTTKILHYIYVKSIKR